MKQPESPLKNFRPRIFMPPGAPESLSARMRDLLRNRHVSVVWYYWKMKPLVFEAKKLETQARDNLVIGFMAGLGCMAVILLLVLLQ